MSIKTYDASVKTLIENPFNKSNFETFLRTVFESADFGERFEITDLEYYPERFRETIKRAEVLGTYEDKENNQILFLTVELSKELTLERARKTQRDFIARIIKEYNAEAAIVAFYVPDSENWRLSFVFKTYTFDRSGALKEVSTTPKRFSFLLGKREASRTAYLQLSKLKENSNPALKEILETFSVERINDEFFKRYLLYFKSLWKTIYNQIKEKTEKPEKKSKEAAHQLLNRLTFVYFIQKKKEWFDFLEEENLIDFLVREYRNFITQNPDKKGTFYSEWLKPLFFSAFNGRRGEINSKYSYLPENVKKALLEAPYLNGGLFEENELDELPFTVPDEFFLKEDPYGRNNEGVIPFLNSYNFTIVEDLEDDRDVAVNPEFIGTVYEKLVHIDSSSALQNPEKEIDTEGILKGIVYTKEPEIKFMVTQSLIYYLKNNTNLPDETIYTFIFDDDFRPADRNIFDTLKKALDELKVVDPACGSGAFLVGMVDTLYKLYEKLYRFDPEARESNYAIRKQIIENNVYGVDVMEWAVRIAELRLWLFLIVEADLEPSQVLFKPLLPNLSFKVRAGDSLIEELGEIDFSILRSKRKELLSTIPLSPEIKRKITNLKKKKLLYAKNEYGAPKKWEIEQEEFSLFREIVEEKIKSIQNEMVKIKKDIEEFKSPNLLGDKKGSDKEIKRKEEELKEKEEELQKWKIIKKNLTRGKRPFIWDIDFVEVFYGDKNGFDIVIGNPPYVRQEKIAPPDKNEEDYKPSEWRKLKKEYKEKIQNMVVNLYGKEYKPDGKADLYVYFYFKALSLLNEKGTLAFITSNSWLDVGFGKSLQEFFLKRTRLYSINDNQSKRSFKEADVNTVIVFSSAPTNRRKEKANLENTAKFVMWRIPFDEAVNSQKFKEYLQFIDNVKPKVENKDLTELAENVISTDEFRVFPVKQKDLLKDGSKDGKYEGNKWGGKFLRAPDIFFTILKKGKGKLVRLGDIADIEGYIHDNNTGNKFSKVNFVKTVKDLLKIELDENSTGVFLYGVKEKGKSRLLADILFPRTLGDRHNIPIVFGKVYGKEFYKIILYNKNYKLNVGLQLNSTLGIFEREIYGLTNLGGGALKFDKNSLRLLLVLNNNLLFPQEIVERFIQRKQMNIFKELGFDPDKPIREQEPNPLPDRKALDNIVFDALNLTEKERKEVYYAVAELVYNRLNKARSVR